MLTLLFVCGFVVGTLGGALGLGGGIVLAPVLLYLPHRLGLERLDIKEVAALTIVQSVTACFAGTFVHRRMQHVHSALALWMGVTVVVVSFVAALLSDEVSSDVLTVLFAAVVVLAAALMLIPNPSADREVTAAQVDFDRRLAVVLAAAVGVLSGLVGQGGAFLVVPLMLYLLKVPTRVTIGTSLAVAFCAAAAGVAGKALSGQVEFAQSLALASGALLGSPAGAFASRRIHARRLRIGLAVVLWVTAARLVTDTVL